MMIKRLPASMQKVCGSFLMLAFFTAHMLNTAYAAEYTIDSVSGWSDVTLMAGDTLVISNSAPIDAGGSVITVLGDCKIISQASGMAFTNLKIEGESTDSLSITFENLNFISPESSGAIEIMGAGKTNLSFTNASVVGGLTAIFTAGELNISGKLIATSTDRPGGTAIYSAGDLSVVKDSDIIATAPGYGIYSGNGIVSIDGKIIATATSTEFESVAIAAPAGFKTGPDADVTAYGDSFGLFADTVNNEGKLLSTGMNIGGVYAVTSFNNTSEKRVVISGGKYAIATGSPPEAPSGSGTIILGNAEVSGDVIGTTAAEPVSEPISEPVSEPIDLDFIHLSGGEKIAADEFTALSTFELHPLADDGVESVIIPLSVLLDIHSADNYASIEIYTSGGTRFIPVAIANSLQQADAALRISSRTLPESDAAAVKLAAQLPHASLITPIREYNAWLVDNETITKLPEFSADMTTLIPLPPGFDPNSDWTVAAYDTSWKFVPHRLMTINDTLYAAVYSCENTTLAVIENPPMLDIAPNHWSAGYAYESTRHLLLNMSNPNAPITGDELISAIESAFPLMDTSEFAAYFDGGIITREELARIAYGILLRLNALPENTIVFDERFKDGIASEHITAAEYVVSAEIMIGTSADTFSPNDVVTRAQGAAVMIRTLTYLGILE